MIEGTGHCGAVRWTLAAVPIDQFGGLDRFEDLPRDGRCVGDDGF